MTFHDPKSTTFPSFPWPIHVYVKLICCSQNVVKTTYIVLFKVFSQVMRHRMHAIVYFLLKMKKGFLTRVLFTQLKIFEFLFSEIIVLFHNFPRPTLQFHDFPVLEIGSIKLYDFPGFPWPVWTTLLHEEFPTHNFKWRRQKASWT